MHLWGFPGGESGKEPTCQCRSRERCGFDPWVKKIPEVGNGNLFQYSYLENPMDRGTWRATVHRVTKSWTQLKQTTLFFLLSCSFHHNHSILSPLLQLFIIINRGLCFATEGNGRREGTMKTGTQWSFPQAQRKIHDTHHSFVQSFTENT